MIIFLTFDVLNEDKSKTILDIGAGTGKYSCYFDQKEYKVTAVELVPHNIDVFKSKNSNVQIHQGNAVNLSMFEDNSFDVTLLFGPMYHLLKKEDKLKALSEAKRVTKPNGRIFISYYMNDFAVITYGFIKGNIKNSIEEGRLDDNFHVVSKEDDLYSMVRIEDIDSFNPEIETAINAVDGIISCACAYDIAKSEIVCFYESAVLTDDDIIVLDNTLNFYF